jgi:hypothetical protein
MMQSVMVMDDFCEESSPPQNAPPPNPTDDEFPLMMQLVTVTDELTQPITPPTPAAELSVMMQFVMIAVDPE